MALYESSDKFYERRGIICSRNSPFARSVSSNGLFRELVTDLYTCRAWLRSKIGISIRELVLVERLNSSNKFLHNFV